MTLAEARAERDRLRAVVKGGADPTQIARTERAAKQERAATTFAAVAAELLAKRTKEGLSPGSVKRERRMIEKDLAAIGNLPIAEINVPTLLAACARLSGAACWRRRTLRAAWPASCSATPSRLAAPRAIRPTIWSARWRSRRPGTSPA